MQVVQGVKVVQWGPGDKACLGDKGGPGGEGGSGDDGSKRVVM